jgi:hypothetical protein
MLFIVQYIDDYFRHFPDYVININVRVEVWQHHRINLYSLHVVARVTQQAGEPHLSDCLQLFWKGRNIFTHNEGRVSVGVFCITSH